GNWAQRLGDKLRDQEDVVTNLPAELDGLYRVVFSPDGKLLATGSMRGWVRLWDVKSGRLLRSRQHPDWTGPVILPRGDGTVLTQGGVVVLAFSPDGALLLSGGRDGTAQLWEVVSGVRRTTLRHPADVEAAAFSPDGALVATGWGHPRGGAGGARLWEV